jgi:hypothetical protein
MMYQCICRCRLFCFSFHNYNIWEDGVVVYKHSVNDLFFFYYIMFICLSFKHVVCICLH